MSFSHASGCFDAEPAFRKAEKNLFLDAFARLRFLKFTKQGLGDIPGW